MIVQAISLSARDVERQHGSNARSMFRGEVPLSFPQQLLFLLNDIHPGSADGPRFNVAGHYLVRGVVNKEHLEWAFAQLVQRHSVLRSVITSGPGVPFQHIVEVPSDPVHFRRLSHADKANSVSSFFSEVGSTPFDVQRPPLVRLYAADCGRNEQLLGLVGHHSVMDNWTLAILMKDLSELYAARASGDEIPPRPRQYIDVAGDIGCVKNPDASMKFWRQKLENLPLVSVPLDGSRTSAMSGVKDILCLSSDAGTAASVVRCARANRMTPFMVILAAYLAALRDVTGSADVFTPVLTAGRGDPRLTDIAGFFINAIIVRVLLEPMEPEGILRRIREACLEAYEHELPIVQILNDIPEIGLLLGDPCFSLVPFQMLDLPPWLATLRFGSSDCVPLQHEETAGQLPFDGLFTITQLDGGLHLKLIFAVDLHSRATMTNLASGFLRWLILLSEGRP